MIEKHGYNDYMVKHGGFGMVPNALWRRGDIELSAKIVWSFILSEGETWNSSRNNISRELGISVNTVTRAVQALKERNMLIVKEGSRGAWDFEVLSPNKWVKDELNQPLIQINDGSSNESTVDLDPNPPLIHNQEAIIQKEYNCEKPKKTKKEKVPQPEVLPEHMPYFEVLKKVGLHLRFSKHLGRITEVWSDAEMLKDYLNNRTEFYQQHSDISENYFKFRGTIAKVLEEEIGV